MNTSMRIPLPLQSASTNTSALNSARPRRASQGGGVGQGMGGSQGQSGPSGRWTSPRTSLQPPEKVTTLDNLINQSQNRGGKGFPGGKDTGAGGFCGQNARTSHDGGSGGFSLSKSFNGVPSSSARQGHAGQSMLDPRALTQQKERERERERERELQEAAPSGGAGSYGQKPRKHGGGPTNSAPELHSESSQQLDELEEGSPEALRREIAELQQALMDKFRGGPRASGSKVVSGAQFRSAPGGGGKCEACETKDASLKKAKETIRSLRFQLSQAEEKLFNKGAGGAGDQSEECAVLRSSNEELAARVSGLEHSLREKKQQLEEQRRAPSGWGDSDGQLGHEATQLLRLEREEAAAAAAAAERQLESLRQGEIEAQNKLLQLKDQLSLKCAYAKDLEDELQASKQAAAAAPSPPKRTQLEALEAKVVAAEEAGASLRRERDAVRSRLQNQELENEKSHAELQRLSQLQQSQLGELDAARATILGLQAEVKDAGVELGRSREEALNAQDLIQGLQSQLTTLRAQLEAGESRVADLQSDLLIVRSDADDANNRMNAMVRRMTTESENSAKAIQKAISSSVRLCVVAPTVNVHVADKKMKFRSNVPKDELEQFLEQQVLSKYTFLFEQAKESCAPDGVTDLQPWIKKVLAEMQESVENHISTAMKNGH